MKSRTPRMISDLLGPPGPFYRSVSIERDIEDGSVMRGYVLTPWLHRVATEIVEGLLPGSRRRAWRITGDFGVGKSALALALVRTLASEFIDPRSPMDALAAALPGRVPRMFPLVISGSREGIGPVLGRAVANAVAGAARNIPDTAARFITEANPFDAVLRLRDAVMEGGDYDGVLLVVDEMGKFLEAANADPSGGDVFRLQELAESASRSDDRPLAVVLVLHQGIQSYMQDGPAALRTEWAKVAERFDEIVFDHPLSHTSALLGAALSPKMSRLPAAVAREYAHAQDLVAALGWFGPRSDRALEPCYPLHPACVPLISRFFAAYGQNERSLFGFIASEEANGLRAFAATTRADDGLYSVDRFFDYVSTSFGHRLVARGGAGDWDRIRAVLDGAATASSAETAVLKTVGILNLLDAPDLIADEDSLAACLSPTFDRRSVSQAIASLRSSGILFERLARAGLRLWTSRRVDLSSLWTEADQAVPQMAVRKELATVLCALPVKPFLLARRHSIETGVTRRFPIRLIPSSALASTVLRADADGSVIAVLPSNPGEVEHAAAWAVEATNDDVTLLVLVAPPLPELEPLAVDLLRHRWIETNAAVLREDAHATSEIERRLTDIQSALVDCIESMLGFNGERPAPNVQVFWSGIPINEPRPIHLLVSGCCDELYSQSPLVQNELINRHALSSAAAGARQRLIEAMFAHAQSEQLGFPSNKNPPERALYLSFLVAGRIHKIVDGVYQIGLPDEGHDPLRLRPALARMRDMIIGDGGRAAVSDIYEVITAHPYGVRAGLSPLLLATILVENRHRIALFERGTYCPKLDAQAFMRILKGPEHFHLQWIALEGVRADVYSRLAVVLGGADSDEGLLAVVAPMVRFAAGLSLHVQRSDALSPRTRAVLDMLMRARNPVDLVFVDLPKACGVEPFGHLAETDLTAASEFASRLETAMGELQSCYPTLLDTMRGALASGLTVTGDLRTEVAERALPLLFGIKEQGMRTFLQRISDRVLGDDAWIEALGGALLEKPPVRWLAQDVAVWQTRLSEACSAFLRLEATSFGSGPRSRHAVRLALTHLDGREHVEVLTLGKETAEQARFTKTMLDMIEKNGMPPALILARLAESLIGGQIEETTVKRKGNGA